MLAVVTELNKRNVSESFVKSFIELLTARIINASLGENRVARECGGIRFRDIRLRFPLTLSLSL